MKFVIGILIIGSLLTGEVFAQSQQFLHNNVTAVMNNSTGLRAQAELLESQAEKILKDANELKTKKRLDMKARFGHSTNKDFLLFLDLRIKGAWLQKKAYLLKLRAAALAKKDRALIPSILKLP